MARPLWTSQRAYILASVAGVVGLGNLWRFPYMAGLNGGGTFVLAYVICVLALGIPIMILEASAGRMVNRGPVGLYRHIDPVWGPWAGWFLVGMTIAIMSYYFVITGWTLGYAIDAVRGALRPFDEFTRGGTSIWYFLGVGVLVFAGLTRGVSGVERTSTVLLPALVAIVVGLAIYGMTLSGAGEAVDFYLSFDADKLADPTLWRMAAGQAFYSLSIGLGFLITYGSYTPRNVNVVASTSAVAFTNSAISITAGLMVFPIVFTFGIAPDTGSQLAFTAFPAVFADIGSGRAISIAFFGLLFLAAFTSCYGGLTVALAPVRDELRVSRARAALIVTALTVAVGIPSALSFSSVGLTVGDKPFLDVMDQITGTSVVVSAGIVGAALIAWRLPTKRLIEAMTPSNPGWRLGPLTLARVVAVGRFLPVAAVALLLIAYFV